MSRKCDICGKGTIAGNSVPRKGLPKKKGGAGQHIGVKSKRVFKPNLVKIKAIVDGTPKSMKICTRCLKSNKIQKA
ncbi:MAG: 50S ribosomal protein L28 [Spirochaetales bacterium]|nr:50S ribosomal protein L28 [Spirochaetales bacterium]MDC7224792.1 50S ribosomal protein L28 [Spirochaetales bacterium]